MTRWEYVTGAPETRGLHGGALVRAHRTVQRARVQALLAERYLGARRLVGAELRAYEQQLLEERKRRGR